MEAKPAAMTAFTSLDRLMAPNTVAVIGASSDPGRIGGRPIAFMRSQGFTGEIHPVNPNRAEIQGLTAYPSVAALPVVPDVAIIAVPADQVTDAVADLGARGVGGAVVFSAGFAETGPAGAAEQSRLIGIARAHGMRVLGPNCLGVFDAARGYYATFSSSFDSGWPIHGRIGIASQSGAYGTHVFAAARNRGIGASLCVTTGNEADVTIADAIGWMAGHDGIDVITVYAEGINDGRTFIDALAAARAARKPVVMMKVGRSALGVTAAQSHTASIAGDDRVLSSVLAEFGVIRARTTEELLDIAHTATRRIYPAGNTLGVLTVSGGAGVLMSDAAEADGVAMPPMPDDAQARLRALVSFSAPGNPVDCTAQAINDTSLIGRFLTEMVSAGGYSSVLAYLAHVGAARVAPALRAQLREVRDRFPDRLYVLSVIAPPEMVAEYERDGWTCHEDPNRAVTAIAAMGRLGDAFAEADRPSAPPPVAPQVTLPQATPTEAEAKRLLADAGILVPPERVCATATEAAEAARAIGFPVVLKIVSPDIIHKTEIGGVLLGLSDADAVSAGFATLMARAAERAPGARIAGVLVARQMVGGVECILGIHRDPVFGPVAIVGLGGVFVDVLDDVAVRRCPFGTDVAETMIRSLRGASILLGARGRPPADIAALAAMLARLSTFAVAAGPRLLSLDLNPVLVLPAGQGAWALDAVIEVKGTE